MHFTW